MSAPASDVIGLDVAAEWFTTDGIGDLHIPRLVGGWFTLDVFSEWLKGDDAAILLWPVAWRHVESHADDLTLASTAAPWVVVEAAVVRRPRRRSFWSFMAFMVGMGCVS